MKLYEVFNLIRGTSTSSWVELVLSRVDNNYRNRFIVIILSRLKIDIDKYITTYSELAETIFREKLSSFLFSLKGKVKAPFNSTKLEKVIRKVV